MRRIRWWNGCLLALNGLGHISCSYARWTICSGAAKISVVRKKFELSSSQDASLLSIVRSLWTFGQHICCRYRYFYGIKQLWLYLQDRLLFHMRQHPTWAMLHFQWWSLPDWVSSSIRYGRQHGSEYVPSRNSHSHSLLISNRLVSLVARADASILPAKQEPMRTAV